MLNSLEKMLKMLKMIRRHQEHIFWVFYLFCFAIFWFFKKKWVKKLGNNTIYAFLVEKESLLNKKFINQKETNSKTCITISSLTSNMLFSLV